MTGLVVWVTMDSLGPEHGMVWGVPVVVVVHKELLHLIECVVFLRLTLVLLLWHCHLVLLFLKYRKMQNMYRYQAFVVSYLNVICQNQRL